jgi:hypothetical protein
MTGTALPPAAPGMRPAIVGPRADGQPAVAIGGMPA